MNSCELWKLCHNYYDKKERKLKKRSTNGKEGLKKNEIVFQKNGGRDAIAVIFEICPFS